MHQNIHPCEGFLSAVSVNTVYENVYLWHFLNAPIDLHRTKGFSVTVCVQSLYSYFGPVQSLKRQYIILYNCILLKNTHI